MNGPQRNTSWWIPWITLNLTLLNVLCHHYYSFYSPFFHHETITESPPHFASLAFSFPFLSSMLFFLIYNHKKIYICACDRRINILRIFIFSIIHIIYGQTRLVASIDLKLISQYIYVFYLYALRYKPVFST